MAARRDTPAMRQYDAFKKKFPDCLLFFRMGDFYEMFDDDAVRAHWALGITLTERTEGIPMAGVPYHSAETYLRRLIDQGFRVAVCDQVQDPKEAKGIVERAVTRVLTPGTLVDESLLSDEAANHLASVAYLDAGEDAEARVAYAVVELSTGSFTIADTDAASLIDDLALLHICELLYCETADGAIPPRIKRITDALDVPATARPSWHFRPAEALEALHGQYGVRSLVGFGIEDDDVALAPAGVIIRYLRETQALDEGDRPTSEGFSSGTSGALMLRKKTLAHLAPPRRDAPGDALRIDAASLRSLEIERTLRSGSVEGSLLGIFSGGGGHCRTAMGKRLLREWLCRPSGDASVIESRQHRVATLVEDRRTCDALTVALDKIQDVARIAARIGLGRATPRDLVALGTSLGQIESLHEVLDNAPAFAEQRAAIELLRSELLPIADEIAAKCVSSPPSHLREGGLIRDGVDAELDEARTLQHDASEWLAEYQSKLSEAHQLPSLKVGYNKVFGYYIELPRAQAQRAPDIFTRKQTLKNAERYITPELKEFEDKVLSAEERAIIREQELFLELCQAVSACLAEMASFAETVAGLDVIACFARKAQRRRWVRPTIVPQPVLEIRQGRHPVLDELLPGEFVANDLSLGAADETGNDEQPANGASLALITGPNMAGKSTFIRQVALLTLLAHTGSFIPAEAATIGLTDRIFTRVGADDALHQGQSTFMVEMIETANILHNATERSLVILDEIGRGTSTLDGLSLAWAIAERLAGVDGREADAPHPRTLFATHYHELTDLAERHDQRIKNLHVAVREWGEEIVFLHRILPGRTNRSYGIHVAKLAGLPTTVVKRADQLLESLSVSHDALGEAVQCAADRSARDDRSTPQMSLFTEYVPHPVIEEIKKLDLDHMSPMDAFAKLLSLTKQARSDEKR